MIRINRPIPAAQIRLLIFDLDGTLIDSRVDLVNSVNAMLRYMERPELPAEVIATYVGDGAPMLMRRALGDPADESILKEALEYFLVYYREHKLDHTHLYGGVIETLHAIQQASGNGSPRHMAVLTNKPVHPSRAIVDALGLAEFFVGVYGGNSFPTKKPDPLGARSIMREVQVGPEETVIVGDSSNDILTGRNAGMWTCGVTYGFAPHTLCEAPPDVEVDHPQELAQLFAPEGSRD
jgi:phosphoglycolate phosphatase